MKILMISSFYYPIESGVEVYAREIAERLVMDGHTVHMITGKWKGLKKQETINGVKVYRLHGKLQKYLTLPSFYLSLSASSLFQKIDYDLIHAHSIFPPGLAARLNKKKGKPLIVTVQGGDIGIYKDSGMGKFFCLMKYPIRGTLKNSKVTAISDYLVNKCEKLGAKNVALIRNGCDTDKFVPTEIQKDYILTISRLVPKNGVDTLISAFKIISQDFPKTELWIVGNGHMEEELKEQAKGYNIKFMGFVDHDKLPKIMAEARLFVRLSRDEGLGIVFAEAMACKTPVLGTNVGGIPELIQNGANGVLVEPNNPIAAAGAMETMLTKSNSAMTQKAYIKVYEEFSWNSIYDKTLKMYKEAIKENG